MCWPAASVHTARVLFNFCSYHTIRYIGAASKSGDNEHRHVFHQGGKSRYGIVFCQLSFLLLSYGRDRVRKSGIYGCPLFVTRRARVIKLVLHGVARVDGFSRFLVFFFLVDTVLFSECGGQPNGDIPALHTRVSIYTCIYM